MNLGGYFLPRTDSLFAGGGPELLHREEEIIRLLRAASVPLRESLNH